MKSPKFLHVFQCNIREEDQVKALFKFTKEQCGKIDLLVNNGGGQFPSPAEDISLKGWKSVIDLNLTGTFLCCKEAFLAGMSQTGGSIVNIICEMNCGFPMMSHTGAARAAVQNLSKSLAVEWASSNIRINCVAPGVIYNKSAEKHYEKATGGGDMLSLAIPSTPARRLGTVEEVSAVVCFLLSDGAQYVSGISIDVGGAGHLATEVQMNRDHDGWKKYEWIRELDDSKL